MSSEALQKFRTKYPGYNDMPDQELASKIMAKHPEYSDIFGDIVKKPPINKPGILGQAWEDLKIPEEKSKEGLKMITDAGVKGQNWLANKTGLPIGTEPTGNAARDVIANTPRIIGETLAETAPGFVSRGAIVTGGLLRGAGKAAEAIKPAAKWLASSLEGTSGLKNVPVKSPGLLTEAFEDPSLMFKPGREAAGQLYGNVSNVRPQLKDTDKPIAFVKRAMAYANNGSLTADEALKARQELDGIKDTVSDAFYRNARGVLDYVARADYSGADEAYKTGIKADALRSASAINKNGTPSIGRSFAQWLNPKTIPLYTPAVQAAGASALGAAYKGAQYLGKSPMAVTSAPGVADKISELIRQAKDSRGVIDYKREDKSVKR